jgi:predicted Fe-S protein YdhL (DUF1289 family)
MAIFPRIQSPCPYKNNLAAVMDGDMCRMCKRQVVDIGNMTDAERVAFFGSCSTEVCVSYRVRPALAALVMAAGVVGIPVAAAACEATDTLVVVTGGIKDPANVEFVQEAQTAVPQLPVVYESQAASPDSTTSDAKVPVSSPVAP